MGEGVSKKLTGIIRGIITNKGRLHIKNNKLVGR